MGIFLNEAMVIVGQSQKGLQLFIGSGRGGPFVRICGDLAL